MKQILKVEIVVYPDPSPYIDVDTYVNNVHAPELSMGFEVGDDNQNKWDALVAAKNYAHTLVSEWRPRLEAEND